MSSNPVENVSEEIKKFLRKHDRGYGKQEMIKKLRDVEESRADHNF